MSARGRLAAVNVVHTIRRGPSRYTAIDKRPVEGRVRVGPLGLDGDEQRDTRNHGGPDRALYAYAREDAADWATELGRELPPGQFGENLSTEGIDVNGALIGERWRIGPRRGGVVVEVRMPRGPCANLSWRMNIKGFHRDFEVRGPGAYLKVVRAGTIGADDPITVESRPEHGITVAEVALGLAPERARALLDSGVELAPTMRAYAERVLRRAEKLSRTRSPGRGRRGASASRASGRKAPTRSPDRRSSDAACA